MEKKTKKPFLLSALISSAGFGLSASLVHIAMGVALILALGMPPLTGFSIKTFPMELSLALVVGLLASPLLLWERWGAWAHPAALCAVFIGLERWVAIDPSKPQMWLAPPLAALAVFGIGAALARWRRWAPWGLAVLLQAILLSVPVVRYQVAGPTRADLVQGAPRAGAPDVLFLVMDTVRAKSVSAYGYERQTTPVFDALAAEGVLFEEATAAATWSLPAHATLFTGTFPSTNNAHSETRFLDTRLPTLAESLAAAGWQTLCFTANPHVSESFGLTRGFSWEDRAWVTGAGGRSFTFVYRLADQLGLEAEDKGGGQVVRNLRRWMAHRPADDPPAFVFVNFLEAHFPFHQLPDGYRDAFTDLSVREMRAVGQVATGVQFGRQLTDAEVLDIEQPVVDMYDGGVLYTDALVGQVLDLWRDRGTLDETVVVVLADHGEFTGEHRSFGHHSPVYEEALHVPLAIRYPPRIDARSRVGEPVSTVGTYATILDLVDVAPPQTLQVDSLLPAIEGRPAGQPALAERFEEHMLAARFAPGTANGRGPLLSPRGRYRTYRQDDLKLAHHLEEGELRRYLFDLAADPDELTDLAASRPHEVARLEEELRLWQGLLGLPELDGSVETGGDGVPELDDMAMEQLRALGYLE